MKKEHTVGFSKLRIGSKAILIVQTACSGILRTASCKSTARSKFPLRGKVAHSGSSASRMVRSECVERRAYVEAKSAQAPQRGYRQTSERSVRIDPERISGATVVQSLRARRAHTGARSPARGHASHTDSLPLRYTSEKKKNDSGRWTTAGARCRAHN